MNKKTPTFAEFNPAKDSRVDAIKSKTDEIIALIEEYRVEFGAEGQRRAAIAVTHYETAAMFAVKSLFS